MKPFTYPKKKPCQQRLIRLQSFCSAPSPAIRCTSTKIGLKATCMLRLCPIP